MTFVALQPCALQRQGLQQHLQPTAGGWGPSPMDVSAPSSRTGYDTRGLLDRASAHSCVLQRFGLPRACQTFPNRSNRMRGPSALNKRKKPKTTTFRVSAGSCAFVQVVQACGWMVVF